MFASRIVRLVPFALIAVATAAFALACSSSDPAELTITATEFKFATGSASPGANLVTLKNDGKQVHHVQFIQLQAGKHLPDVLAVLATPNPDLSKIPGKFVGGVGQIAPGASARLQANLEAGAYALLCFVPDTDGAPHMAKGMAAELEVKGEEHKADFAKVDLSVSGKDYAFEGDATIKAGSRVIELKNAGKEPHEANLVRLADNVKTEDVLKALASEGVGASGPPPFTPVGGAQAILPGDSTRVELELTKGSYMLVCFIPNAKGTPHVALGMAKPIKVE